MLQDKYINKSGKRYSGQDKAEFVLAILSGAKTMKMIHDECGVSKDLLSKWKTDFLNRVHALFEEKQDNQKDLEKDKMISRQSKEIHLLKKLLQHYKSLQKSH